MDCSEFHQYIVSGFSRKRKASHIKCLIKTRSGRKRVECKKGTENNGNKYETVTNMVDVKSVTSRIILNANGVNTPVKRQRLSASINKIQIQEIYFKYEGTYSLKVKGWGKLHHANTN